MASKVIVRETKTEIIVRIPKTMVEKSAKELTEDDVLKIIEEGNREYRLGKTQVVSSLRELLSS